MPDADKSVIGPSTGWLYARGIFSLAQQEVILKTAGANALEICLSKWESCDRRMISLKESSVFDGVTFCYKSIHLPDVDDEQAQLQLEITKNAMGICKAAVAVTHPLKVGGKYPVESYKRMISAGISLALENTDSRVDSGFNLSELERLVATADCRFVLDVQHAYEHDHAMVYAGDLFESFKDKLAHLHVSGETKNNIHSLVHQAANAKTIIKFTGHVLATKNVPLILEGKYTTHRELQEEIKFLRSELGL